MGASIPLIASGTFIFIIFTTLGFGGLDLIIHTVISKVLVIDGSGEVWKMWRTMPLPIYLKLRFFNITNPDGLARGEKAVLQEMGPYVYLEDWEKVDLTVDHEENTVRYRMTKTYFFQPHLSNGTEEDEVTFINIVLLASSHVANELLQDEFMTAQMSDMMQEKGERLTKTATVRQVVFDGVSVQAYVDLFTNPLVQEVSEELGLKLPDNIKDGLFAIFKHKNMTDDGWFVVKTGADGTDKVNQIVSYNNQTSFNYWKGDECNVIKGTDGTLFSPFMTKDSILHIYAPQICRSFALEYHSEVETKGLETYRFIGSHKNWQAPKSNPNNWCYCNTKENETALESCVNDGVFSIWPCSEGAPILLSQPHFLGAEDWIINSVEGLSPDFEKHSTVMDFHPLTGSPVVATGKMQLGIELYPYQHMSLFANVQRAFIPMLWFEEGSALEGEPLMGLKFLDGFRTGFAYAKYIFICTGIFLTGLGVLLLSKGKKKTVSSPNPIVYEGGMEESAMDFGPSFVYSST